jgi:glycosyltransferase involved in cell wall biosynthesis
MPSVKKTTNVFVIPSWYPSKNQPLAAIFIKEQLEALADLSSNIKIYVSLPPDESGQITPLQPFSFLKACLWYTRTKKEISISKSNQVTQISHPALSWSPRFGGMGLLIKYHQKNFAHLLEHIGHIDLIHAHVSFPCGYVASVLSEEYHIPFVITEHMGPFPFKHYIVNGKPRKEIDQALRRASETIAVSPALAQRIASFGYRQPIVIPNMIDERRFDIKKTSPHERFVFFSLTRFAEQKGIDTLLEAISIWNPPTHEIDFRIGGHGSERIYYYKMAKKLGIFNKITWLGSLSREEAPRYFQEADVFVLPSRHESFGVVCAEAIASGIPVIATKCGGPEFIINDLNGRLVEIDDAKGLANAMMQVYSEYQSFSPDKIREDFMKRFSHSAVVPQIINLYHEIIKEPK